ncbi:hypothetical protein BDY19DRAFT_229466 [Irpex rosettiformis]|uniref:Uncharacterized protein n=1 Tax=Irpex rosettiformis TaxID=378272 RepID=A0ACB8U0Y1_9APHY|nr:hypothetical protein BDY19DRAFT_229466 [Irpex rosettiformis]
MTKIYGDVVRHSSPSGNDEVENRPKKRPRISLDYTPTQRRFMLEEVDVEIAMHERIASVLESRMTWALLLQKTLEDSQPNVPWTIPGFQDSVVTALEAVEEPCNVLYSQNLQLSLVPPSAPSMLVSSAHPPSAAPEETLVASTRRGPSRRSMAAPPRKLLYLLNRTTHPPQTVKLACPDCGKTSFSSLQGLLNHCRLSHSREFGSHDECVQCCAVLVESAEEQAWVVANGAEVTGIGIPGLKRLFELAVGGGQAVVPILPPTQQESETSEPSGFSSSVPEAQDLPTATVAGTSSVLTRTLGHHIDTPALAPFLGRESKRRSIRVYDEELHVDVLNIGAAVNTSPWRMHYTHRSKARASLDEVVEPPEVPPTAEEILPKTGDAAAVALSMCTSVSDQLGSRFHITGRVSIRDLSLWVPPARRTRSHPDCSHKWRLAVSSSSYTRPLSTFLVKLTVTCLTEPPPSTFSGPIIITKPPFIVTGLTDRPFLARLTFEWSGRNELNPPMSLEHWVDLDPIHYTSGVLGEEQFFDVELDRHTEFLPETTEEVSPGWTLEGDHFESSDKAGGENDREEEPDYVVKLRSLLPHFPMTAKDAKGRSGPPQVPYTLVSTPSQLRSLVYGRRKAIEWSRAHAIRSAYDKLCTNVSRENHSVHPIPLTTGDVFNWLEDEGLFLRRTKAGSRPEEPPLDIKQKMRPRAKSEDTETFCRYCGLHFHLHPTIISDYDQPTALGHDAPSHSVKQEPIPDSISSKTSVQLTCRSFQSSSTPTEFPVVDVNRLIAGATHLPPSALQAFISIQHPRRKIGNGDGWSRRDLLSVPPPQLISAVARFLFRPSSSSSIQNADNQNPDGPLSLRNRPRNLVDDELAPAALLALVVKPLVGLLAKAGVATYRQDEAELGRQAHRARRDIQVRRLLTPMHVVRGLQREAQHDPTASALLLTLSPLGMSLLPSSAAIEDFHPAEVFQ